jgi:hypothetical protein
LYGGGLLGLIFCFGTRMVAFWLRDDSGRLDTILISPFVTRALESYHMGFGRNGGGVLWSSLMMDCTWYVSGLAFRLGPSLNAAGLRFRFACIEPLINGEGQMEHPMSDEMPWNPK